MTPKHDSRPRPQYGEYADPSAKPQAQAADEASVHAPGDSSATDAEGTSIGSAVQDWARAEDQAQAGAGSTQGPATPPAPTARAGAAAAPPVAQQPKRTSGPLPGVPHNLGAKGSSAPGVPASQQPAGPVDSGNQANQAAPNAPYGPTTQSTNAAANTTSPAATKARPRGADRIVTIVLLAVGSYFALSMALTLSQFTLEFSKIADELGVKDFSAPPALKTLGTVGAILVLAIYALVLIFSIRRLRARKVTFWAPLVAGVLAWVIFFVLFFIGLNQSAELWQALLNVASDPAAAQQMLERLGSNG